MDTKRLIETVLQNWDYQVILERLSGLRLPDAWLVTGLLFQTVCNVLIERPTDHGIKDYDLLYFDRTRLGRPKTPSSGAWRRVFRHRCFDRDPRRQR